MLSLFKFPFKAKRQDADQNGMDFTHEMIRRYEGRSSGKEADHRANLFDRLSSIVCKYKKGKKPNTPEEAYSHYRRMLKDIEKDLS